jgi:predicted nucleic acid-binding protein
VPDPIVINTGPLITLARIDCLDLIGQLPFQFFCPEAVRDELDEGEALGYSRVAPDWLKVAKLSEPPSTLTLAALDLGEASVIQLALELKVPIVAIDEWKGRRAATASGLQVTGTLGLLGRAKSMGLVSLLRPLIDKATQEGIRYHPDLVRAVLQAVDETDE